MQTNFEAKITKYVESKRDIWTDGTVASVRSKLRALGTYLDDPRKAFRSLVDAGRGRYYINSVFVVAAKFEREVLFSDNFTNFLREEKAAFKNCYKQKTKFIKPEELEGFLNLYAAGPKENRGMYNLLMLMGTAGLRLHEAMKLRWEDIDNELLTIVGKGGKKRQVPFEKNTLIKPSPRPSGKVVGTVAFRYFFKRDLKPWTPHDFRVHYATSVGQVPGLSTKDVSLLLGHESIVTTEKYMRSDISRVAKVLKGRKKTG